MKEDITQIPSISSYPWAIKVSKIRIDCTSLSVAAPCTAHASCDQVTWLT